MPQLTLKTTHKCVVAYYENLKKFEKLGMKHEGAVSSAFHELLEVCARQFDWKLVPQYPIKRKGKLPLKADGALVDNFNLSHGIWEARDSNDDLEKKSKQSLPLAILVTIFSFRNRSRPCFINRDNAPSKLI
ncbi:MAG: hypothetical protein ABI042_19925 [Verrucomicrobiota bacterium]